MKYIKTFELTDNEVKRGENLPKYKVGDYMMYYLINVLRYIILLLICGVVLTIMLKHIDLIN